MFLREHDWKYSTLIFGLSMCYPLYDFLRRSLYIVKKEFIAAILSLSLFFVTALSYFIMYFCGIRKADDYLLVLIIIMSLTSLSIIFLNRQNYSSSNDKFEIKKVIFDYWKIGKWAAASMLCFWVITQGSFIGTVAKLAMRQPFVLFKGLTFQKLCLPGAFRPGDHHNKMLRPGLCVMHASPQYL
ncbi:hypothetical protein WP7S18E04_29610 [Klebsiella sp. WP7-S18-ESBL-04]|nr:hypothetical protein WP7S18E04_29610 [Klebsiella sp. WP7-S18-ESBL-04]